MAGTPRDEVPGAAMTAVADAVRSGRNRIREEKCAARVGASWRAPGCCSLSVHPRPLAADVDHGKQVFQACAACHSDKPDALGPSLVGVIGRKAGSRDDFRYSNAMTRAGFNWDAGNLRQYLADPQAKVKGNRMPFSGLNDPKDVDDVIAYIGTLK